MSYDRISEALLACMKKSGAAENGTVYTPPDTNHGTATTKVPVFGTVVLAFVLDPESQVLTYYIQEKPHAVPDSLIWSRVAKAIADCKSA